MPGICDRLNIVIPGLPAISVEPRNLLCASRNAKKRSAYFPGRLFLLHTRVLVFAGVVAPLGPRKPRLPNRTVSAQTPDARRILVLAPSPRYAGITRSSAPRI